MAGYDLQGDPTPFTDIFDRFFGKITDDMYFVFTKEDTKRDACSILIDAIPNFEFPRFGLYDYEVDTIEKTDPETGETIEFPVNGKYNVHLTPEEINILALYMMNGWLQRQITSIENTRQKYSGSDFKMTSQANHLTKLIELKKESERQAFHMQRLYKRRKIVDGKGHIESNWSTLMENSALDG